jgi:hypothetical protein
MVALMKSSSNDAVHTVTGYSGWILYCALISCFGVTGYYSDLVRPYVPAWLAVGVFVAPVITIVLVNWGEAPDKFVRWAHIGAATLFMLLGLGMIVGELVGYRPEGAGIYHLLAHLG